MKVFLDLIPFVSSEVETPSTGPSTALGTNGRGHQWN